MFGGMGGGGPGPGFGFGGHGPGPGQHGGHGGGHFTGHGFHGVHGGPHHGGAPFGGLHGRFGGFHGRAAAIFSAARIGSTKSYAQDVSFHNCPDSEGGTSMNTQQISEQQATAVAHMYSKLVATLAAVSVFSNILAAKVWGFWGFTFDGGLWIYPLTFLVFDLIVELFGEENANRANNLVCTLNILGFIAMVIVNAIPAVPGTNEVAVSAIYGGSLRVIAGSVISYWISHWLNNRVHQDLFKHTDTEAVRTRSWLSTMIGQIPDTLIFNLIAFFGTMSFVQLLKHMVCAYAAALIVETVMTLLFTKPVCNRLLRKLQSA